MIDIHTHILHCVDDGSSSVQKSIEIIKESASQGVTDIILTPHFNRVSTASKDQVEQSFLELQEEVKAQNVNVNLHLGHEVFYKHGTREQIKEKQVLTLAGSNYILVEFDPVIKMDIPSIVYEIKLLGYKPIVAHYERCYKASVDDAFEIRQNGGFIQINANAIAGDSKRKNAKLVKGLFKNDLIDFVASDIHDSRVNHMGKAYAYVRKKYGVDIADKVFINNAKKIIEG